MVLGSRLHPWDEPTREKVEQELWRLAQEILRLGLSVVLDFGLWTRISRPSPPSARSMPSMAACRGGASGSGRRHRGRARRQSSRREAGASCSPRRSASGRTTSTSGGRRSSTTGPRQCWRRSAHLATSLERWPMAVEWDRCGRRPASKAFVRHFGGWGEAC